MTAVDLRFCAILDPERVGGDLGEVALAAARGGCTLVELRGGGATTRTRVADARRVKASLEGTAVRVLVAGRVDVALAAEADGVHLEQNDMHANDARRLLGRDRVIGVAVRNPAQADELYRLPVDFSWVSSIFAPENADPDGEPNGLNGLSRVAFRARLASGGTPVGARGGLELPNVGRVVGAGADGVAVRLDARSPEQALEAAGAIRRKVDEALATRASYRL